MNGISQQSSENSFTLNNILVVKLLTVINYLLMSYV